jgi:Sigma-70 region 2
MLGDIGAAEDVVQDAFSRLLQTSPGEIDDARGWLIAVTSRLCLDQIRSARARRERPHDASEIEFTGGPARLTLRVGCPRQPRAFVVWVTGPVKTRAGRPSLRLPPSPRVGLAVKG